MQISIAPKEVIFACVHQTGWVFAGATEIAGQENAGLEIDGQKLQGWIMTDIVLNDSWRPCACIMAHVRLRVIRQKIPSY